MGEGLNRKANVMIRPWVVDAHFAVGGVMGAYKGVRRVQHG